MGKKWIYKKKKKITSWYGMVSIKENSDEEVWCSRF